MRFKALNVGTMTSLTCLKWPALAMLAVAGLVACASGHADASTAGLWRGISVRQPLGPTRTFKQPTRLDRWTNSPRTDAQRGLRPHSYWVRPDRGPTGGNQHLKEKLNLDHSVKRREQTVVRPGTKYHERPLRGGADHTREVILHDRVPKHSLTLKERVGK